jgi:prepilin peptidase CpaA
VKLVSTFWIFLPAALFGGLWDLRYRKVPNILNFGLLFSALTWHAARGNGFPSAAGAAIGLVALFVPYCMGGMGAGDVKFMAALGAAAAWPGVIDMALWSALSGGILVIVLVLRSSDWRGAWLALAGGNRSAFRELFAAAASRRREKVPYALAMTAGFILSSFIPILQRGVTL